MLWNLKKSETFYQVPRDKALAMAQKHASMSHSPTERPLDKARVKKIVAIIRGGLALPFSWATVWYGGVEYRENGQHSSAAILELGAELPDGLTFHVDTYEADSREGMVSIFRQFDQRWSSRSALDVAGAYSGLNPDLAKCDRRICKAAAEAISWYTISVEGGDAPKGDRVFDILHMPQYGEFIVWLNAVVNARRELTRKEVIAAMFVTHLRSQSGADKFWREVAFGENFFSDDQQPGAVLISELTRAQDDKEFKDKEFEQSSSFYKKSVKAWNAFCAGDRINSLKVAKKGWPDVSDYTDSLAAAA